MRLESNFIINSYSILILMIIYSGSLKNNEKESTQYKLYMLIIKTTLFLLVVDTLSRFDGLTNILFPIFNQAGNFLIFMFSPLLPSLWLLYVCDQVFGNSKILKRFIYPLVVLNLANAVMVFLTQIFGWYYVIDAANIYHRGSLFMVPASIAVFLLMISFSLIIANRKNIEKQHYFSLFFFAIPPLLSIILQVMFYSFSLMLNSIVLSLLIIFLNIQTHSVYTDYLTGVNNVKKLDIYMKEKIRTSKENSTFALMVVELSNYQEILDHFGMETADKAMRNSATLISSCLRADDFISRYNSDFCIVLNSTDMSDLGEIALRLNFSVEKFNQSSEPNDELTLDIGYDIYETRTQLSTEAFLAQVNVIKHKNKLAARDMKRNFQNE